MIDIHSHIIHGIDDGPATIEESMQMAYRAAELGIRIIVATPHYKINYKNNGDYLKKVDQNLNELREKASHLGIKIVRGFEVRIDPFLADTIEGNRSLLFENSDYMLIELPFDIIPLYSEQVLYNIQLKGVIPIIAHAERNIVFQKNNEHMMHLIKGNIALQVNAESIVGKNGRRAKNLAMFLINNDFVDFIASDAHSARGYDKTFIKAYNIICKVKGKDYADALFCKNRTFFKSFI